MDPSTVTTDLPPITCRVTRWYFWRVAKFAALFLVTGLWFGYDALVGYPKENAIAEQHDWFQNEVRATYAEMEESGTLSQWPTLAERNGWPLGKEGESPAWVTYAASKGWPEKPPHPHSEADTKVQLYISLTAIAAAIAAGIIGFLNRNRTLSADSTSLTTPAGKVIPFSAVKEIDLRPWRTKGFARITFETGIKRTAKSVIDDLKYGGAAGILQRLEAHFDGVLIEEILPGESGSDGRPTNLDSGTSGAPGHAI